MNQTIETIGKTSKWEVLKQEGLILTVQVRSGNQSPFKICAVCFTKSGGRSAGLFVDSKFCSNCGISVGKLDEEAITEEAKKRKHD